MHEVGISLGRNALFVDVVDHRGDARAIKAPQLVAVAGVVRLKVEAVLEDGQMFLCGTGDA